MQWSNGPHREPPRAPYQSAFDFEVVFEKKKRRKGGQGEGLQPEAASCTWNQGGSASQSQVFLVTELVCQPGGSRSPQRAGGSVQESLFLHRMRDLCRLLVVNGMKCVCWTDQL